MTKTTALPKPEALDSQAEAELTALFREIDQRLKRIRKRQAESARLRERTRAALARMKAW